MDSVLVLQPMTDSHSLCIFCQRKGSKTDPLRSSTPDGVQSIRNAYKERKKLCDKYNTDAINRLQAGFCDSNKDITCLYHKNCFSSFTSKPKIARLVPFEPFVSKAEPSKKSFEPAEKGQRIQRSITNWKECLVCQKDQKKESLHLCMIYIYG